MRKFDAINLTPDKRFQDFLKSLVHSSKRDVTAAEIKSKPFRNMAQFWYFAFVYAVRMKLKPQKIEKSFNMTSASILTEEQQLFMTLTAIDYGDLDDIGDANKMMDICNQLATAGLDNIKKEYESGGGALDPIEHFTKMILDT